MRGLITLCSFILACTFLAGNAGAAASAWEKQKPSDYRLPDPPNAKEEALEIDELLKLQVSRSIQECDLGQQQATPDFQHLFNDSAIMTSLQMKTLAPLMKRVSKLGERISGYFKEKYHRTRPYDVDSRLKPCVKPPGGHKSYPSSHATIATLDACVLTYLFPGIQNELIALSKELSERRMKVGVHFPSDVKAGSDLGVVICYNLAQNADFMKEVEDAKKRL